MPYIVLGLLTAITILIPFSLTTMLEIKRKLLTYTFFICMMLLTVSSFILFFISQNDTIDILFMISATWIGILFYLTILLVLYRVLKLFLPLPPKASATGILIICASIIVFSVFNAFSLTEKKITIPIAGLKNDVKIALAADVHMNTLRNSGYVSAMIKKINMFHPDFTVFAGDIVDSSTALKPETFNLYKNLESPSFFILGNHDLHVDTSKLIGLVKSAGITFLQNEAVEIAGIYLTGLDYMDADENYRGPHRATSQHTIKEIMPDLKLSKTMPNIILTHKPDGIEYIADRDVDLILAGHTHGGGQIFPITLISPYMNLNKYIAGIYHIGNTKLYVSEGAGTFALPLRFSTSNELTLITLTPQ